MKPIALSCLAIWAATSCVLVHAADSPPTVEKCSRELGSLAVAEPQAHVMQGLSRYGLASPGVMLRMLVQESGCFAVVERGAGMQNLQQERALAAGGQLQADSNVGRGQLQVADFVMTPAVQFSGDTGGVGGSVGSLLGRAGGVLGALGGLAGGVKFKEAETNLLIADVRSGIQVASAEGKASKMNFSLGGWGWGGLGWAAGGGYSKTPEGKLIAASLLDNYNKIVLSIRDRESLIRSTSAASRSNAAQSLQATPQSGAPAPMSATAPAPLAPMAPAAPAAAALPGGLFGAYSGQLAGGEQGSFSVVVSPTGQVSGFGQSQSAGNFNMSGSVSGNGTLVMAGQGQAGLAQFSGFINPATGELVGTWRLPSGAQGTFTGKRQ